MGQWTFSKLYQLIYYYGWRYFLHLKRHSNGYYAYKLEVLLVTSRHALKCIKNVTQIHIALINLQSLNATEKKTLCSGEIFTSTEESNYNHLLAKQNVIYRYGIETGTLLFHNKYLFSIPNPRWSIPHRHCYYSNHRKFVVKKPHIKMYLCVCYQWFTRGWFLVSSIVWYVCSVSCGLCDNRGWLGGIRSNIYLHSILLM